MDLKPLLLFSILCLISCANSAAIYDNKLSQDEYISRVLLRSSRSPNIWNLPDEKTSLLQKKDLSEEQRDGSRHENVIFIDLAPKSETVKPSSEDKHESSNLWSILGKTTDFFTPPFIKAFLPRMMQDDIGMRSLYESKVDLLPFYPDSGRFRSWKDDGPW